MQQVKMGIIGLGSMGMKYAKMICSDDLPEMVLTAVSTRSAEGQANARAELPQGVRIFATAQELLEQGDCDAVIVTVPHYLHPEVTIAALQAGKHVLCDKPAGVYTKQVREMNEVAEKSGKAFGMIFNQRTNCLYRKMRELVQDGTLGEIHRINWIITDWYRPQAYYGMGAWRATWAGEGGGVLINQCPHNLDLLQWICGMPTRVSAFCHNGKWHDIEVEDDVTAYMEFENGATGVFVTTTGDAPGTNRFEISGDKGKLVCEDGRLTLWRLDTPAGEFSRTSTVGFSRPAHTVEEVAVDGENEQQIGVLRAFAAHLLRGEPQVAEGVEGIRSLSISNAMHLSSWLGCPVDLPVDEERYLQELDRRRNAAK